LKICPEECCTGKIAPIKDRQCERENQAPVIHI
jgi:hypothetical protein